MREAKLYYELPKNAYIVSYEDCFFDQFNQFFLVLEYCDGGCLDKLIEAHKQEKKQRKFPLRI